MRIVLQRVLRAEVRVDEKIVGRIDKGFLLLVGIGRGDDEAALQKAARKIAGLRIFEDNQDKMNLNLDAVGGSILAISNFTLYGDTRKGYRPGFTDAAPPEEAERLFNRFVELLRKQGVSVETGRFGARMDVELINWGPVTLILDY